VRRTDVSIGESEVMEAKGLDRLPLGRDRLANRRMASLCGGAGDRDERRE
jgi:hypothetical protein